MKSGLHPYCKECARDMQRESRARNKHFMARKAMVVAVAKADPVCKVYEAIRNGLKTRVEIRLATKLNYDQIGDALAELMFDCKAVRTYRVNGEARFGLVDQQSVPLMGFAKQFGPRGKREAACEFR